MPLVKITILKGRSAEAKKALMDAVHGALVSAFGIPENDRIQQIIEHDRENFVFHEPYTDDFTLVEVAAFAGRTLDAKRALYKGIVTNIERDCGISPREVFITLDDRPMENWGIRGGIAACDIDFSFKIDV